MQEEKIKNLSDDDPRKKKFQKRDGEFNITDPHEEGKLRALFSLFDQ